MNRETARLRTEVVDGRIVGPSIVTTGIAAREHDALYAHALVQALNECRDPDSGRAYTETSVAANAAWILTRADELMREWGAK